MNGIETIRVLALGQKPNRSWSFDNIQFEFVPQAV